MNYTANPGIAPEPIQPGVPRGERAVKPPWRPRVSGIAGFVCGPLAGGLIAFINLRRLNEPRKAAWTLILTILGCVVFGLVVAKAPDSTSTTLGRLIGNFVSPFLYPLLQLRPQREWQESHPGAPPDRGWRSSGWAILGLVAFLTITIGTALAFSYNEEIHDIEVNYEMPDTAKVGETVSFTIKIANRADRAQLLHSLDVDTHFLQGIWIARTNPPFKRSEPNLLAPVESYVFNQTIPAKGETTIDVEGRAIRPGAFPLTVEVCVNTATACSGFRLDTITVK
jgi:hypothetical protein